MNSLEKINVFKVLVTGNNRTKRSLVGLKGVVKKAVGLGGWHWLVLSDGSEVRLQRNALQVLEQPTGDEEDSSSDEVTAMPRQDRATTSLQERKTHPSRRTLHERRRDGSGAALYVNFNKLQSSALKRYRRHYKLQVTPDATKDQLVNAVGAHFMSQKIDERKLLGKLIGKYSSHS